MTKRFSYHLTRTVDAPLSTVWEVVSNHEGMVDWTPLSVARLDQVGSPDRNGTGAVRFLGSAVAGREIGSVERVVSWDPPHSYEYTLEKGMPILGYLARVELTEAGTRTRLDWSGGFDSAPLGTGPVWVGLLKQIVGFAANRAVAEAERRAKHPS